MIDDRNIETNLQIVSISFQEGNKWRFSDGNASFYANITDTEFAEKVKSNEASFCKDDILNVVLNKKQYIAEEGIKTDYTIIKVKNHRSAAKQLKLPFIEKNPDF